jgi:GAF domain-containing protein
MSTSDTQTLRHLQQENIRLRNDINALRDYVDRFQRGLSALVCLQDCVTAITEETNIFHLIQEILAFTLDAVDSENGALLLLDDENGEMVFVEVIGGVRDKLLNHRQEKGLGLAGWVVKNRQTRLVEDVRMEQYFTMTVNNYADLNPQTMMCTPLLDLQRPLGAIEVVNTQSGRPFTDLDKEIMTVAGNLASSGIIAAEKLQT